MTLNQLRRLIARLCADPTTRSVDLQTRNLTRGEIAEARWLAVVLMRSDLFSTCPLRPEHFQHQTHFDIFRAMLQMQSRRIRCNDLPELLARLDVAGYPEESALEMLSEVLHCRGQIKNFEDYTATLEKRFQAHQAAELTLPNSELVRLDTAGGASPFQTLTTAELIAQQEPLQWLAPGIFVQNEPAVIVGPSKSMKSSIAVDLCAALASGGSFLGQFTADRPFRVGYVSRHDERQALSDLAGRWSEAGGVDSSKLPNLIWSLLVADAADPAHLDQLRDWIRGNELEVVVIDAVRLTSTGKQSQAKQLCDLVGCCKAAGATPILCCQSRKAIPRGATLATDVATSLDFARQWMLLQRRETYSPGSGQHRLRLTYGGCAGQGGEWGVDIDEGKLEDPQGRSWQITLRDVESIEVEAAANAAAAHDQRLQTKIHATLTHVEATQATKSRIREQCGINGSRFAAAWDRLLALGKIKPMESSERKTERAPIYRWIDRSSPPEKNEAVRSAPDVDIGRRVRCADQEKCVSV
ncbi:AAA family ATPase [Blastopirellula marina]|uniref:DNA helicase DnaB-like N-terminal domain-containing protein n=1 Tax=Blastopirellula marina DSM 3645 TaxID=314230 RepID=A3ZNV6_9BACT|nr:AAA family ATPase [Blastopirellula marina]EAQ82004.1 hypothetical protein DSM3645_17670 [Blastopirellula marina DSM 3645]